MKIIVNNINYDVEMVFPINTTEGNKNIIMYTDNKVIDGHYDFSVGAMSGNNIMVLNADEWQTMTQSVIDIIKENKTTDINLTNTNFEAPAELKHLRISIDTINNYRSAIKNKIFQAETNQVVESQAAVEAGASAAVETAITPGETAVNPVNTFNNEMVYPQEVPQTPNVVTNEPTVTPDSFKDAFAKEVDNELTPVKEEPVKENTIPASTISLEERVNDLEKRVNELETLLKKSYQDYSYTQNTNAAMQAEDVDVFGNVIKR